MLNAKLDEQLQFLLVHHFAFSYVSLARELLVIAN
jgi:hypothetical protein